MARRGITRLKFKSASYHGGPRPNEDQTREQRRHVRGQHRHRKRHLIYFGILALLVLYVYQFGFIRSIRVEGLNPATTETIKTLANRYLDRSWYARFKPLAAVEGLSTQIELSDSRFSGTTTSLSWLSSELIIASQQRAPVALWQPDQTGEQYLLDENGVVYEDPQANIGGQNLPLIVDTSAFAKQINLGQQAVSQTRLEFVRLLAKKLNDLSIYAAYSKYYQFSESPREIRLIVGGLPYYVRFNTDRGATDQASELAETLAHLSRLRRTPSDYIDLRVDDTAYYR